MTRTTLYGTLTQDEELNENEKAMLYIKECAELVGLEVIEDKTAFSINFIAKIMKRLRKEPKTGHWIPVSERLPETDNENSINNYNVLLWVKNKSHPEREPQIYLGKLKHVDGDDGSGNFWGIETKPCDWAIWGWCYLNEPEVIAWQPLPQPYTAESEDCRNCKKWEDCPCGKEGHESRTSQGYSIGECKDFEPQESEG